MQNKDLYVSQNWRKWQTSSNQKTTRLATLLYLARQINIFKSVKQLWHWRQVVIESTCNVVQCSAVPQLNLKFKLQLFVCATVVALLFYSVSRARPCSDAGACLHTCSRYKIATPNYWNMHVCVRTILISGTAASMHWSSSNTKRAVCALVLHLKHDALWRLMLLEWNRSRKRVAPRCAVPLKCLATI